MHCLTALQQHGVQHLEVEALHANMLSLAAHRSCDNLVHSLPFALPFALKILLACVPYPYCTALLYCHTQSQ